MNLFQSQVDVIMSSIDPSPIRLVNTRGNEILIPIEHVRRDDENFVSFEFNTIWHEHAETCPDCGALWKAIAGRTVPEETWYVERDGKYSVIDLFSFGHIGDPTSGHLSFINQSPGWSRLGNESGGYYEHSPSGKQTKMRFRVIPCDRAILSDELKRSRDKEHYERCSYLQRAINEL